MGIASDSEKAVQGIPGLTEGERQYLLTVAQGEGGFGRGWDNPSAKTVAESAQFGLTGHEGKDSKNWGAIQGIGSAGSFFHVDHHKDGKVYKGTFKSYRTDTDAAADIARTLLKPNVKAALAKGSLHDAVFAQHANGYFELDPNEYLVSVIRNYNQLSDSLGWKPLLKAAPASPLGLPAESPAQPSGLPPVLHSPAPSTLVSTLPTLRLGVTGTAVLLWQRYLKSLGISAPLTGVFDGTTEGYTRMYQTNRGLKLDGEVGRETWNSCFQ